MIQIRIFELQANLAVKVDVRLVGVFEHMRFAAGHQICCVFQIPQQVSVQCATARVEDENFLAFTISDETGVYGHAKCIYYKEKMEEVAAVDKIQIQIHVKAK